MAVSLTLPRLATSARATVWMPAIAVSLFMIAYMPLASRRLQLPSATPAVIAAPQTPAPHQTPAAAAPTVQAASTASPGLACSPMAALTPSDISLTGQAAGLTVQTDPATTYQIYGRSAAELHDQIRSCAPGASGSSAAEFTAETSYRLNWQYDITMASSGCSLTNIRVGLHITTVLPYWQADSSATAGLSGRWQTFLSALTTHESGHAALDRQYATNLLNDLQVVQNVSCSNLNSLAAALINQDVQALNVANDNYDIGTNHGATQGAVLPTH